MANYSFVLYERTNTTAKCLLAPRSALDITVDDERNGVQHLQIVLPLDTADHRQRANQIVKFDVIRMVEVDGGTSRSFRVYHYTTSKDGLSFTIEADDLILDLARVQFVLEGRNDIDYTATGDGKYTASNATVTTVLTAALSRSDFTVGTVTAALDNSPKEYQFNGDTALSVLQKMISAYKSDYPNVGYRRNDAGTIDFVSDLAQNTGAFVINRKNLLSLSKEVDAREYANRVFAWGAKASWQHVHSGIESTITSLVPEDTINSYRIYVHETNEAWKWRYGDTGDVLYSPTVGSIVAAGTSARTLHLSGISSIIGSDYRGGVIEITSGELNGVFRMVNQNDASQYFELNDELHFTNDVTDITGETFRLSKKVRPVDIWGFGVKTSNVESSTTAMIYDSTGVFTPANAYNNGYIEFMDGNLQGNVSLINSHNNNQLFVPTLNATPANDSKYRITANTPADGCLSIETPEITFTANDVIIKRVTDFGGGLTIGKYPKFRTIVASATNALISVATGDGSKFDAYQVCQVFTSQIGATDRVRSFDIQQFEINSIDSDVLYPSATLTTTPSKGDELEALTLVNSTEITSWGDYEAVYRDESITDPYELYLGASKYLADMDEERLTYVLNCLDLYKTDPNKYQFDEFDIGDTISIFDEETQISAVDLRVVRKVWKPLTPWVVESIELTNAVRTLASRQAEETKQVKKALDAVANRRRAEQQEVCLHWDTNNKRCRRQNPPNTLCESELGNNDGKFRCDMTPINISDCAIFTSPQARHLQPETDSGEVILTGVNNANWDNTNRLGLEVDFGVDTGNAWVSGTQDESTSYYLDERQYAQVRIQVDANGDIVPYDSDTGLGAWVQFRRLLGSNTLKIWATYIITGYKK